MHSTSSSTRIHAIKTLRKAIKAYNPCCECGNEECIGLKVALEMTDGLVIESSDKIRALDC